MKRLYKNDQNKMIGGVCSGVAEYFGIDPSIVRIIWALLGFFYSVGFWIYVILWLVLPSKSQLIHEEKRRHEQQQKRRDDLGFDTSDAKEGEVLGSRTRAEEYSEEDYYKESRKNQDGGFE